MNIDQLKNYFISLGISNDEIEKIIRENKGKSLYNISEECFKLISKKVNDDKEIDILINYINKFFNSKNLNTPVYSLNGFAELIDKCNIELTVELFDLLVKNSDKLIETIKLILSSDNVNLKNNLNNTAKEIIEMYCNKSDEIYIQSEEDYILKQIENDEAFLEDDEDEELDNPKINASAERYLKNIFGTTTYSLDQITILPDEEIYRLATLYKNDKTNIKARNEIIVHNIKLVFSIAFKFSHIQGVELDDIISVGIMGLIKALDKYDPDRAKFSTYATWWIKQTILRYISDNNKTVRIPIHKQEEISRYIKVRNRLFSELKREPTDKEIQNELNVSEQAIKEYKQLLQPIISLNETVGEDEESELQDFINSDELSPEDKCILNDNSKILYALSRLKDDERLVIQIRYGFFDERNHTLEEAADLLYKLGYKNSVLTRERVRQIEEKAFRKIKQALIRYGSPKLMLTGKPNYDKGMNELEFILNNTDVLIMYNIINTLPENDILFLKECFGQRIIGNKLNKVTEEVKRYVVEKILPKIKQQKEIIISKIIAHKVTKEVIPANLYYKYNYQSNMEETIKIVDEIVSNLSVEQRAVLGKFYDINNGTGSFIGDFSTLSQDKLLIIPILKYIDQLLPVPKKKTRYK